MRTDVECARTRRPSTNRLPSMPIVVRSLCIFTAIVAHTPKPDSDLGRDAIGDAAKTFHRELRCLLGDATPPPMNSRTDRRVNSAAGQGM